MTGKFFYIVPVFFALVIYCYGQNPVDQPEMPSMYKVSVDPFSGADSVIWHSSTDGLVDYYAVCYSIVTNPNQPYILSEPIDSIYPPDTIYVNHATVSDQHSVGYSVIAVNVIDENNVVQSVYDYPDSTVYAAAVFDSCKATATVSWNIYNKWKGQVGSYRIYQTENGLNPQVIGIINVENMTTFEAGSLPVNTEVGFFVETIHKDGIRTTRSNMASVYTAMLKIPGYINGHSANPNSDNSIMLDFEIDPGTELSVYKLLRSTSVNGIYDTIDQFSWYDQRILYTDMQANTSVVYYYQLLAVNNCNMEIKKSNIINNIVLSGENEEVTNQLIWNPVEDWAGETERYVLYRRNLGSSGQIDSILLSGTDLSFTDDVSGFFTDNNAHSATFCYRIKAVEANNPYTQNSSEYSNEFCIDVTPGIKLPNAFIPNNRSGENSLFRPVFQFQPADYKLVIYNRWGNKVWEGNGPWDGLSNNSYVPEGVYGYELQIYYPDNTVTRTGYVTVIYR